MEPTSDDRVPRALALAVFLISVAVISFEIALTRCFSVLLRYHYVFLIVSIATFGLGAGGLIDYLQLRRKPARKWTHLTVAAALYAVLPSVTVLVLFQSPLSQHLTNLWIVAVVVTPPFLAAGAFLSCVWRSFAAHGGRLYAADLLGAAVGSVAVITGLQFFGGTGTPMAAGILAGIAASALAWRYAGTLGKVGAALSALAPAGLLIFSLLTGTIDLPTVPVTSERVVKTLYQELGDPSQGAKIIYTDWNAFARTDVVQYHPPGEDEPWEDLFVYTDGDVPTNMRPFDGDMQKALPSIEGFIGFLPFRLQRPKKVLLVGPGGGLDVMLAFATGAEEIDGVELNPSIPKVMQHFADFNGHLYDYANVNVIVDEGRSYLTRTEKKYDMIYMALTYSATTAGTGGLALVESYLHTVEALRSCISGLAPGGQVVFVCGETQLLIREFLTALTALEEEGMSREDALRSLAVVDMRPDQYQFGPYRHMLLIRKEPFTPEQSAELAETAIIMGLMPGYCPGVYEPSPFSRLSRQGVSLEEFDGLIGRIFPGSPGSTLSVMPVTDDRPFFADLLTGVPAQFGRFMLVGLVFLLLLAVAACVTHALAAKTGGGIPTHVAAQKALYFIGIGIGFMVIEVCLAQKLILYLGYPTLSLAVILFALLLGGGMGSQLSQSWPRERLALSAAIAAAVVAVVSTLGLNLLLTPLFAATLQWPILARTLTSAAFLVPLGFGMGMLFPTGVRRLDGPDSRLLPWMWALNGTASVLGSVAAMCAAKLWGFHMVLLLGGACYFVVAILSAVEHFAKPPSCSQEGDPAPSQ